VTARNGAQEKEPGEIVMTMSRRAFVQVSAAATTAAAVTGLARTASAVEDFFRGKSVRVLVGTTPGAGYDLIARLLAQNLGRMIPGNPSLVVENMPGAGSLTMMNYLYNRAPRDGTVFGLPLNGVLLEPTLKLMSRTGGAANFDIDKMAWVGSTTEDAQVLWFRSDSKIKTVEDLRSINSIAGASAPGADNFTVAVLTNNLLGAKMNIVRGYQGTNDVFLAVERGEADGSATAYSAVVVGRPQWLKDSRIRILAQFGRERLPELPDVPTAIELAADREVRDMLSVFAVKFKATYPFVLPPAVPADRVEALRRAFDQTMTDTRFLEDAKKSSMPIKPLRGPDIAALIRETYAVPERTLDRLRTAVQP
jgi:tripartite-type tricarboxylate transporter receptor subunit TctC